MPRADEILAQVAREDGVSIVDLRGSTRGRPVVAAARQRAMRLMHAEFPTMSWSELGRIFGRDRTTIRHACTKEV